MAAKAKVVYAQDLILFRLSNSYKETLQTFSLSERRYWAATTSELNRARSELNRARSDAVLGWGIELEREAMAATAAYVPPIWVKEVAGEWLEEHNDTISRLEQLLFRIESEYLEKAYHDSRKGTRTKLPDGSLKNPHNIELLVAEALESNIRGLRLEPRYRVIELLEQHVINAPEGAALYLHGKGLKGVMNRSLGGSLRDSPLATLQIYDAYLQRTQQYAPLFNLEQRKHLHPWDTTPKGYIQDYGNVELRIAHTLEENIPGLRSASREEAIELLEQHVINAPEGAALYLHGKGLKGVMTHGVGGSLRGSPREVLRLYDGVKMRRDGCSSMFDAEQGIYFETQKKHVRVCAAGSG